MDINTPAWEENRFYEFFESFYSSLKEGSRDSFDRFENKEKILSPSEIKSWSEKLDILLKSDSKDEWDSFLESIRDIDSKKYDSFKNPNSLFKSFEDLRDLRLKKSD